MPVAESLLMVELEDTLTLHAVLHRTSLGLCLGCECPDQSLDTDGICPRCAGELIDDVYERAGRGEMVYPPGSLRRLVP